MPDLVTLDVLDHPTAGMRRALQRVRAVRAARPEGLRAILPLGTAHFVPRPIPAATPRRIAVLAAWQPGEDVDARWTSVLGDLAVGSREHWHVEAQVVRAAFTEPWKGWLPDVTDARPLDAEEPALIVISGDLHARWVPAFLRDSARAVAHAFRQPGYLGGLAVTSSVLNTTSCSCWRTYQDARNYAFASGDHADAMRRDRGDGRHKTEWFLRLRPLLERGSLSGTTPLAPVLAQSPGGVVSR